ncbi:MAG: hypothetical protein JNG85_12695, partial [Spirochaetaceae bacterium]|nr:hypothetical protein [Spirochaetaceae bacterium]
EVLLPAGPYEEIELKLDACLSGGASIIIEGTYTPAGGAARPFSLSYSGSHALDLKLPGEKVQLMDINEATNQVLVAFRIDEWFSGIGLPSSGAIVLNPETNVTLLADFIKNFIKSMDYGEDLNGDGILSDAEDDDL